MKGKKRFFAILVKLVGERMVACSTGIPSLAFVGICLVIIGEGSPLSDGLLQFL